MLEVARSRLAFALALGLGLVAAPAHSQPKPAMPAPKTQPAPTKPTMLMPSIDLDAAAAKRLALPKLLSKPQIADIAKRYGIVIDLGEVRDPISLTIRRPYHGPGTQLQFFTEVAFDPGQGEDGTASLVGGRIDSVEREQMTLVTTQEEFDRLMNPWSATYVGTPFVARDGLVIGIHAARNRDYVVSCRVDGVNEMGAFVQSNGKVHAFLRDLEVEGGRVSFAIARDTTRRHLRISLVPRCPAPYGFAGVFAACDAEFSVSRCDITPAG